MSGVIQYLAIVNKDLGVINHIGKFGPFLFNVEADVGP